MKAENVKSALDEALFKADMPDQSKPKLLSDNGSRYVSQELAEYWNLENIKHVRGRPLQPQTQGIIERCHRC